jgi:hypothetical protein
MLGRFERLMEQAVEGSLRRVFATSVQPIQLAKAAARAMEQAQVIGPRGPQAPNVYEVRLAAADLTRFAEYAQTLCAEIRAYLLDYAAERGLRFVAEPRVELIEDAGVAVGRVLATARFAGLSAQVRREVDGAIESTRQLRLAELAAARSQERSAASAPRLRLTDAAGLDVALEPAVEVVRLGRAADNDVVISDQNVSRYHAQLRWVQSGWLVYDLTSTNGTWVDGDRLLPGEPRLLAGGSRVRLGAYDLEVVERVQSREPRGRR